MLILSIHFYMYNLIIIYNNSNSNSNIMYLFVIYTSSKCRFPVDEISSGGDAHDDVIKTALDNTSHVHNRTCFVDNESFSEIKG